MSLTDATNPEPGGLLALVARAPMPPGYQLPPGAAEHELAGFETRTGLRIVPQFKDWLRRVNGAMVGPGGIFGVRHSPSDILSIERYLKISPKWREVCWVPIAADGVGDYWVVADGPDGSDGWVAFIDTHIDPDAIDCYAASTVYRFLNFLLSGELGEQGWPGIREYVVGHDPALCAVPDSLAPWRRR